VWADRETLVDLINVQHLVATITDIVANEKLLPTTIGVFGDWGSGKSSLVAMTRQELEKSKDVLCITFDGSLFEGYEDAKAALMSTILEEIRDKQSLSAEVRETVRVKANKLLKRVNLFRFAGFLGKGALSYYVGEPLLGIAALNDFLQVLPGAVQNLDKNKAEDLIAKAMRASTELAGLLKDAPKDEATTLRRSVTEFRKDFAELLKESTVKTLVVFIDELDRCMPDTVLDTLQAIRLFLAVPGTAFVIAADERLIEHAVQVKFPLKPEEGRTLNVGRHYLEKIVHHPVRIPPLSQSETMTYMNLLFTSLYIGDEEFQKLCTDLLEEEFDGLDTIRFDSQQATNRFTSLEGSKQSELLQDLLLVQQIGSILTEGLDGNPRQTKRFINMLRQRLSMAKRRRVTLKSPVLAKLMLLEYFRLEAFKLLSEKQVSQEGKPRELAALEGPEETDAKLSKKISTESKNSLDSDFITAFQADPWLNTWVKNEPKLSNEDLRAYFFFAREKLKSRIDTSDYLSNSASEVLNLFLSSSGTDLSMGKEKAKALSPGDAAMVLQNLASSIRRSEDLRNSPLTQAIDFVAVRQELVGELVQLLKSLPITGLSTGIPPKLKQLFPKAPLIKSQVSDWSKAEGNDRFKTVSETTLKDWS
jgi:predicted KAP-like P-loop ATPase